MREAFIKIGWNNPTFKEISISELPFTIIRKSELNHKYFVMIETGNIFKDNGDIACYNIKPISNQEDTTC